MGGVIASRWLSYSKGRLRRISGRFYTDHSGIGTQVSLAVNAHSVTTPYSWLAPRYKTSVVMEGTDSVYGLWMLTLAGLCDRLRAVEPAQHCEEYCRERDECLYCVLDSVHTHRFECLSH